MSALRRPERLHRLVVVNGWARLEAHTARCFDARLALLRRVGVGAYIAAQPIFLYPAAWISEHSSELDAELPHQLAGFAGADVYEKRIAALREFDVFDRLNDLTVPTLAYASRDDMLVPFVCSAEMSLNGPIELELVGSGGHAINVTVVDRFDRDMLTFLALHPIKDR